MNNKIIELLKKPYFLLVWSLICGGAYLAIIAQFVGQFTNTAHGAGVIIWIFFPAIVCGGALLVLKSVKNAIIEEQYKKALTIFYTHLLVIAMGILIFASMLI
ncbi:MAG: hypothetical protein IJT23_10025 [Clostridia bacterium]|nr:hypothetical protein [Clostridia bacterium]